MKNCNNLISSFGMIFFVQQCAVRALTSSRNRVVPSLQRHAVRTAAAAGSSQQGAFSSEPKFWQPTRRTMSAKASSLEEDLDAALDDLLGEAFTDLGDPLSSASTKHKVGFGSENETKESISRPQLIEKIGKDLDVVDVPASLDAEDVVVDLKDPKFLSTSNPYWTKHGLDHRVIDILSGKGITAFTPVQAEAFTPVKEGRDVIGRSRTGTGKTLAFGLPSMIRLQQLALEKGTLEHNGRRERGRLVSMLILCPTRELARQVQEELAQVAKPLGLFTTVFHGGVSYEPQARDLRNGIDILVGTPGRLIDHLQRGNLDLSQCDIAVLDEADEMLNMGFADDVEVLLEGVGSANSYRTQCLLFSATTPDWVSKIGRQYQKDALMIDSTAHAGGARVATTVRHMAVQVPYGKDAKYEVLEDIIAVEISKDMKQKKEDPVNGDNVIAAAAAAKKAKSHGALQQKIFGKTIVFTETKREADEIVSGSVFKSLTAQALHGDVGQKQRDATLNAFRAGAFNVLVATDVAARGIDISDVDLVVQMAPPRDVDTYVHRSGRTGRAGRNGTAVLMFNRNESRDIVKIERSLGHKFQFELAGPPTTEAAMNAAAKTSATACLSVPQETADFFKDAAAELLEDGTEPTEIIARCLAAISRRHTEVISRSLLTGEKGLLTVEMSNNRGRPVSPGDVMFTVSKLSRMSKRDDGDVDFDGDVGKIQTNFETGTAMFDLGVEDAKKLVEFSAGVDAGGAEFSILQEMEIERDHNFGRGGGPRGGQRGGRGGPYRGQGGQRGGRYEQRGGGGGYRDNRGGGYRGGGGRDNYRGGNSGYRGSGGSEGGRSSYQDRGRGRGGGGGGRDTFGGGRDNYGRRDNRSGASRGQGGSQRYDGGSGW